MTKHLSCSNVSLEALLLALLNVKSTVATILKDAGLTDKELRAAIHTACFLRFSVDRNLSVF